MAQQNMFPMIQPTHKMVYYLIGELCHTMTPQQKNEFIHARAGDFADGREPYLVHGDAFKEVALKWRPVAKIIDAYDQTHGADLHECQEHLWSAMEAIHQYLVQTCPPGTYGPS